jgi:hypothetical protein
MAFMELHVPQQEGKGNGHSFLQCVLSYIAFLIGLCVNLLTNSHIPWSTDPLKKLIVAHLVQKYASFH